MSFDAKLEAIDKKMWLDDGINNDLDYLEQSSWILFLKLLEDTEQDRIKTCLLYTSPSPRDFEASRMPSSA